MFDQVRDAGPDESWWIIDPTPHKLPDTLAHCTSSSCHEAIIAGKNILQHLLALEYSPNIFPLAAPTWCLSSHMTAIAFCDPPNVEAYIILAQNAKTKLNLRIPISIHVLHLATAHLDVPLLQIIEHATRGSRNLTCTRPHSHLQIHTLIHSAEIFFTAPSTCAPSTLARMRMIRAGSLQNSRNL